MHNALRQNMIRDIRAGKDGGTYLYPSKDRPINGRYVVGVLVPSLILRGRDLFNISNLLFQWSVDHDPTYDYGFWWDGDSLYIDAVSVVSYRLTAHTLAIIRNEIAYYDLIDDVEVRV